MEPVRLQRQVTFSAPSRHRYIYISINIQLASDRRGTARLVVQRRQRSGGVLDRLCAAGRVDLLGELHAAGAIRAVGVGHSDSCRADLGPRRAVAVDDAACREGESMLRDRMLSG